MGKIPATNISLVKRKFPFCLARHIFREFIFPLGCFLLAFSLLFLLNDVFDDIADFSGKNIPLSTVFLYFLYKLPVNLVHVIPVSVLLATSFMTVMLGKNNELYAMRSAGLSLAVCATPVWVTAFLCSLAVFGISEEISPACQRGIQAIQQQYLQKKANKEQQQRVFQYSAERRSWFFSSFAENGTSAGIIVRQTNPDGSPEWVLSCRNAEFLNGVWNFKNGEIYRYTKDADGTPLRKKPQPFELHAESFPETPDQINDQSKPVENLRMKEIYNILHGGLITGERLERRLRAMLWHRLTFPIASLAAAFFGFALSLTNGRTGCMKGFATAIGSLVLYFIMAQFFLVLGKNGWVPPLVAGAFFPILFLCTGATLLHSRQ